MEIINIGFWVLLGIVFVFILIVRNLLKQNEQLEDRLIDTIESTRDRVFESLQKMREIDNREAFEKDDEVGTTFNQLKNIVEELNEQL